MPDVYLLAAQQAGDQVFRAPSYFTWVALLLLVAGALGWFLAAALGFMRARAFGSPARWFAAASVCLVLYHIHFLVLALGLLGESELVLSVGAFFNLFIALGAVCAVVGFTRLTDPRP